MRPPTLGRWGWAVVSAPALVWTLWLALWPLAFWGMVFDDSFYYWEIARNVAAGQGSTFDGLNETNGYHPLWMLICAGLFALGLDGDTTAQLSVWLQLPMLAVGLGCLWLALRPSFDRRASAVDPAITAGVALLLILAASSKDVAKLWLNGLESGVVLLLQAPLLLLATRVDLLDPAARRARALGSVLLTGAFLARTDGALLLPAIALWALPRLIRTPLPTARALVELLLLPSLVVVVYMGINQAWMGTPVQVSGQLKRAPFAVWRWAVAGCVMLVPLAAARALKNPAQGRTAEVVTATGFFGIFCAGLLAYYGFLQLFARLWYFGPLALWGLLVVAAGLGDLMERGAAEKPHQAPARAVAPLLGMVVVVGAISVGRGAYALATGDSTSPLLANRDAGLHIAATLPDDAVLASWDAGVLGFYADRPVVNLDGVVNSGDYLRALRSGHTDELLADTPIGWVVNHGFVKGGANGLQKSASSLLGPRADGMRLVGVWPFFIVASLNGAAPTANAMQVHLLALPSTAVPASAWHEVSPPEGR